MQISICIFIIYSFGATTVLAELLDQWPHPGLDFSPPFCHLGILPKPFFSRPPFFPCALNLFLFDNAGGSMLAHLGKHE